MRQLAVYTNRQRAGLLTEQSPGRDYAFVYDADYLAAPSPPVSLTLPKRQAVYRAEHLFPCRTDFERFGRLIGLPPRRVGRILDKYMTLSGAARTLVAHSFLSEKMQRKYLRIVDERIKRFVRPSE